jgi:molecular chaperone GrpE (heat shock protein)
MQSQEVTESPEVMQLLQKGYALYGRTLRPAQVAVSRTA